MINKKIAMSAMSILTAISLMGGATYAYFSDTATSSNNSFGAGTLDLTISNDVNTFSNDVSATFAVTDMFPGKSEAKVISLRNNASTPIAEIALGLTATNAGTPGDLRDVLELTLVKGGTVTDGACVGGTDITQPLAALYGDNNFPLTMKELNGQTFDSLPIPLAVSATDTLCVGVKMSNTANNDYNNTSANATFSFIAHQDTSQ